MDRQKIRAIKFGTYIMTDDQRMQIVHTDKGFTEITGYSSEEALKLTYMDLIPEEDREEQLVFLSEIMVGERPSGYLEHRLQRKDGSIGYVLCFGHPYEGSEFPNCTEIIIGDSTDARHHQRSMRREINEKKRAFDTLISSVPSGVITFEVDEESGKIEILTANDEFFAITGRDRAAYMQSSEKEAGEYVLSEDYEKIGDLYSKIKNSPDETASFECRLTRGDGNVAWVVCRIKYFQKNEKSGRLQLFCTMVDITREKYNEMDMEVKSKLYKKTADYNNNDFIFRYNVPLNTVYLTSVKRGNSKMFYDMSEFESYVHPDHRKSMCAYMERLLQYVGESEIEVRTKFCSEDYHWCRINAGSMSSKGIVDRIDGTITDIDFTYSEKNVTEEMLDSVTGFYKSIVMQDIARNHFSDAEKSAGTSLMIFGLKYFEGLAEFLGMLYTDIVIKKMSQSIKAVLPDGCTIGRISIYTFMVIVNTDNKEDIIELAENISLAIKNTYIGADNTHKILFAAGVTIAGADGNDYDTLFSKANAALKTALDTHNDERILFYDRSMPCEFADVYVSEDRFISYHHTGAYDIDFVNFAFSILSGTKDVEGAINIILEQIGERYDVEFAAVYMAVGRVFHMTNQWVKGKGIVECIKEDDIKSFDEYKKKFNRYGVRGVNDIEKLNVSEYEKDLYRQRGIKALLGLAFFDTEKNINGHLTICDTKTSREWDKYDIKTLSELSKVLYVFIRIGRERDQEQQLIKKLSTLDPLTGIYNIDTFRKEASNKIGFYFDEADVYAVTYIDLNNFSYINENYGYAVGDRVLIELAKGINNMPCCVYACRRYSDYFIALLAADTKEEILGQINKSAEKVVRRQKRDYSSSDLRLNVGVYFVDGENCDINVAIENANLARKAAREDNTMMCKVYNDEMRDERNSELMVAGEFEDALENDEFQLYLQPKFHLESRKIVGAEALVRWRKPDGTMRYPDLFIPALEKNGDIVKLDFHMYEKVMQAMSRWQKEGRHIVPVSVNFSRVHMRYSNFVKHVSDIASKYGIDRSNVEIEITEGALSGTSKMMDDVMALKKNGFKVDIDDFGTGYSSLNLLLEPLFDVVKVDKSIINSISNDTERNYVRKLVELIRNSDKRIIFEGVETEEQAALLIDCGCHTAQGYLFSKPLPLKEFEKLYI